MSRVQHRLVTVVTAPVAGDFHGAVQDADRGVGSDQSQRSAHGLGRDRVMVEVEAHVDGLGRADRNDRIGGEGAGGRGQQAGLFFGEGLGHRATVVARPGALMGHLVPPEEGLTVAFGQGGEGAAGSAGVADIANGAHHAPFLISRPDLTGACAKVVVGAQLQQPRVEVDLPAAAHQQRTAEIVVQNHAGLAGPGLEGMHVPAQKVLHGLVEEEPQIQRAGVGKRDEEAGEPAAGAADRHQAELGPVHLRLLGGKRLQAQERFWAWGPQTGHRPPQLDDTAGVAALADHLVAARGSEPGMSLQALAHELQVGIGARGPRQPQRMQCSRGPGRFSGPRRAKTTAGRTRVPACEQRP